MYDLRVIKCESEFDYPRQSICDNDNMEISVIRNKPRSSEQSSNKITERTTNNTTPKLTIIIRTYFNP